VLELSAFLSSPLLALTFSPVSPHSLSLVPASPQTMEYTVDKEERAAKRAAYGPVREREEQVRRKLALTRSAARGSAAAAGGGGDGHGGGGIDLGGNGSAGDAELEEANRGLPPRWVAQRSRAESGRIYWFHEGRYNSGQWSRPGAGVQLGGEGGAGARGL
jgi:hypothetical protein